jgi:hypothetical protein
VGYLPSWAKRVHFGDINCNLRAFSLFVVPSLLLVLQVITRFVTLVPLAPHCLSFWEFYHCTVQSLGLSKSPIVTQQYLSAESLALSPTNFPLIQALLYLV